MRNRITKYKKKTVPIVPRLEKDIQTTIISYLKLRNIQHSVTNADRVWGRNGGVRQSKVEKGWPDISAVLPVEINGVKIGVSLFIEVKTLVGTAKPEQKEKLQILSEAGAVCILARKVEDVVEIIERYKDKSFTADDLSRSRRLLELNLSDRRNKEVKDALASFSTAKSKENEDANNKEHS